MLKNLDENDCENPVTAILAVNSFFNSESNQLISIYYVSETEALSALYWEFHKNLSLQAFIVDQTGKVIHSIDSLSNTIGIACRQVYGVQAFTKQGKPISAKISHSGSTVPTYKEALEIARNIIQKGFDVKVSLPDGKVLNTKDIQ